MEYDPNMEKRSCGSCTKCCEGYLEGEAFGHKFYRGRPCQFLAIGTGCTIYADRPKDPCVSYNCGWIKNSDFPEWMKPSEINAIIDTKKTVEGIEYLRAVEAGEVLSSNVLTWLIQYVLKKNLNFYWEVNNGKNFLGSQEFIDAMTKADKGPSTLQ